MDQNKKNPNTADALLEKLKRTMEQNDSDKESIAAEEAAAKKAQGTRYKFRVMKRDEYLEKKRIADAFAQAADEADISDDDLEALLRTYLKKTPTVDPIVEAVPAEAPAAEPVIDLDKPLSREETPFFEDTPMELDDAAPMTVEAADTADGEADIDGTLSDEDLDALLLMIDDSTDAQSTDDGADLLAADTADEAAAADIITAAVTAEEDEAMQDADLAALLASIPEDGDDTDPEMTEAPADDTADAALTEDDFSALLASIDVLTAEAADAEPQADTSPAEDGQPAEEAPALTADAVSDDELEALLAAIEEEEVPEDGISEDSTAITEVSDDALEAMLAAIEDEAQPTDRTDGTADSAESADTADDAPQTDDDLLDALASLAADSLDDDMLAELVPDASENGDAVSGDALPLQDDLTADADDAPAPADTAEGGEAGEFDQTDLDLMIAFGMEDQLENAVGHERAKKYKKAIGDRSDDHFHEMHSGDRPDTVQDKHAEYVSAAQNREIFAEYKKKYSGMLFRFLGALFFLVLLFFFENDRLLGITLPAIFDREQYPLVYTLFDLQLVLLSGAMVWRGIRTGIRAIFRARPIPESITGFLFLACIVYTAVIASLCPMHGLQLYNFPIGLAVLFELCYEFMNLRREIMSFKIVSSKKLKYAVDAIAPKDGEAERKMFAEYISDDPALFRIKRTAFVESFFARTETYPRTQRILRAVLPAVLLCVLAFFSAKFILSGSVYEALTVAYITMLLTLPSCAFIAFSYPMYRASGFAYEKDSAMIGEASLGEYADASVVSFDDKEVFPARGVRVRNVKVYGENRIDHVIYAAASVFHVVGGPLADVFETATGELGYAENVKLTRLDRDGIEARVDGGTVLIGRAAFINRYGYSVSLNESEKSMEETGDASILYIAYDNNVSAKLYIQYSVEPDFEVVLKQLYRQGVCVGIKTSDPNIDDHLLSCKIKMSKYPVKIIKCAEPKETAIIVDRLSSGIVSKSSAKALLQTLAICDRVLSASRTNNVLGVVSILLGMAAMAFCIISGMAVTLAPVWIALYQLFWIIPVIAISRYYI